MRICRVWVFGTMCCGFAGPVAADCAPTMMVKAVYVNATPGVDSKSFVAQPKTTYRVGTKYGRVEESPNPTTGIHGLIVVQEPDVWMVDRNAKAGRHIVDTGAPHHFRAPVLGFPDTSAFLMSLEFGCEVAYVKEAGAVGPETVDLAGRKWDKYDVTRGIESIMLLASPGTDDPYAIAFYRDGKTLFAIRYLEYSFLQPDLRLFERPKGIMFQEGR